MSETSKTIAMSLATASIGVGGFLLSPIDEIGAAALATATGPAAPVLIPVLTGLSGVASTVVGVLLILVGGATLVTLSLSPAAQAIDLS